MNEYVEFQSSLCLLKKQIGLGCIHFLDKEELNPFITRIIGKINEWLLLEGKTTVAENVQLVIGYFEEGLEKLTGSLGSLEELIEDYDYSPDDPGFIERYFIAAWMDVYKTIYLEELYNHADFFTTDPIDCHECCGKVGTDSEGYPVYIPGKTSLASQYVRKCGCCGG